MQPEFLVHIGFHKTATSFLQRRLFSCEELGFFQIPRGEAHSLVHQDLAGIGSFDYIDTEVRQRYQSLSKELNKKGLIPVLSHERLSGYPASGCYDSKILADRIKELFPTASILIVIREQLALIRSMYSQYITDGGGMTLYQFLNPVQPRLTRIPLFNLGVYEFDKLIAYYQKLFGSDKVLALPYEMLTYDYYSFVEKIGIFTFGYKWAEIKDNKKIPSSEKVNIRRSVIRQELRRLVNAHLRRNQLSNTSLIAPVRFTGRIFRLLEKCMELPILSDLVPVGVEQNLDAKAKLMIQQFAGSYYAKSNSLTSTLINLDLSQYGYMVESNDDRDQV